MRDYATLIGGHSQQHGRQRLVAGILIALGTLFCLYLLSHDRDPEPAWRGWQTSSMSSEVNPFQAEGYLDPNPEDPWAANWIPLDSSIAPAPDWPSILRAALKLAHPDVASRPVEKPSERTQLRAQKAAVQKIPHLRNTTVLLIGDSVDRNQVIQVSELLGIRDDIKSRRYQDIHDPDLRDWDTRGVAHLLQLPEPVNLDVANCFIYGLDDHDEFAHQEDWHAPGKAEDRLETLCRTMTDQLPNKPSIIQLHSGLWDCSYFARIDRRSEDESRRNADKPLTAEQMEWWQRRMKQVISKIKHLWPNTPIIFRKLHRPRAPQESMFWTSGQEHLGFVDWFVDVRVAQIREMQEKVAKEEGLMIFDFGHIWEGYQGHQDGVHPRTVPGGVILDRALLHFAYLAHQAKSRLSNA